MIRHPEWLKLHDLMESRDWDSYIGDKLGNALFLEDPERADRREAAAENGCDGSTHGEAIQDWRDFMDTLDIFDPDFDVDEDGSWDITMEQEESIVKEIDNVEKWYEEHDTLEQEIG